jgi:uncharacterized protein
MHASRTRLVSACLGVVLPLIAGCDPAVRSALFHPTHHSQAFGLNPWTVNGERIGFARIVEQPANIWLLLHGNAGQAADRTYALPRFSPQDSVYILEYPGFGERDGTPSFASINQAAVSAYEALRQEYPEKRIGVAGESIGSGPSCVLAMHATPPDKIVLLVPFDDLTAVAKEHMSFLPVGFIMGKTWDNAQAMAAFRGPVEIYAALDDRVIPMHHAKSLANKIPHARLVVVTGGHNDWSTNPSIKITFE